MPAVTIDRRRAVVRHPLEHDLPAGNPSDLTQAAEAVKHEYRASVKWKKLRCREVLPTDDGSVFKLDLGQTVEFDWTWEGATAFRPTDLDAIPTFGDDSDEDAWAVWSGEVVEVDEAKGIIFVWVADPDRPPTKGAFYVRPFEFLAFLHSIYCESASGDLRRHLPGWKSRSARPSPETPTRSSHPPHSRTRGTSRKSWWSPGPTGLSPRRRASSPTTCTSP